jgi:hypothetical protein
MGNRTTRTGSSPHEERGIEPTAVEVDGDGKDHGIGDKTRWNLKDCVYWDPDEVTDFHPGTAV